MPFNVCSSSKFKQTLHRTINIGPTPSKATRFYDQRNVPQSMTPKQVMKEDVSDESELT